MAYLLALGAALFYGGSDFLGGLAARRISTVVTVAVSQCAGLLLLFVMVPLLPDASPSRADLLWGVAAGVSGGLGVALLYRALAIGTMAIVAPITAVCAVIIPVVIAVALGERPTMLATLGIVLAIAAIALVSRGQPAGAADPREEEKSRSAAAHRAGRAPEADAAVGDGSAAALTSDADARGGLAGTVFASDSDVARRTPRAATAGVSIAVMSGVALGLFFFAFARTSADAGLWPLLVARALSTAMFGVATIVTASSLRMTPPLLGVLVASGIGDVLANTLYLIASRSAPLSVVVTLASLYPASTVMLARLFLAERLTRWQSVGVGCALVAVLLIVRHS